MNRGNYYTAWLDADRKQMAATIKPAPNLGDAVTQAKEEAATSGAVVGAFACLFVSDDQRWLPRDDGAKNGES